MDWLFDYKKIFSEDILERVEVEFTKYPDLKNVNFDTFILNILGFGKDMEAMDTSKFWDKKHVAFLLDPRKQKIEQIAKLLEKHGVKFKVISKKPIEGFLGLYKP